MDSPHPSSSRTAPRAWLWLSAVVVAAAIGYVAGRSSSPTASIASAGRNSPEATSSAVRPQPAAITPNFESHGLARTEPNHDGDDWQTLRAGADTPQRDHALAGQVERLARTDARSALALAQAEKNWRLRQLLRDAAIKGWASVAPDAAADWVLALKASDRRGAVGALFDGAAEQPAKALQIATRLASAAPETSSEFAHLAIDSLGRAGAYETAAALATQLGASDASLLTTAYLQWSEREPDAALAALHSVADPTLRRSALQGVVDGWALADPEQLAQRAREFSPEDRTTALSAALSRWADRDPAAAAAWIEDNDPGQDADDGIVAVSEQSALAETSPQTALRWAGLIVDPAKRTTAVQSVLARWASRSPAAARQYAESLPDPNERAAALAILPPASS